MPSLPSEPARHDDDALLDARLDQGRRDHQRVHRRRAERLHVDGARPHEPAFLGDRLGHVAAAALVAVAHRLLAASDRVRDGRGVDVGARQQVAQRVHAARLDREVLEQHVGAERLVVVVVADERSR